MDPTTLVLMGSNQNFNWQAKLVACIRGTSVMMETPLQKYIEEATKNDNKGHRQV